MAKEKAEIILDLLETFYGNVTPDLAFQSIYELTIAVVLSAQTTDKQVNGVTPKLFATWPGTAQLAKASRQEVETIIRSTGFYKTKAANIIGLAKMVEEKFSGTIPSALEELTSLPGVGRKSANVILSMGHGIPALAVDTHIMRLARRLGLSDKSKPDDIEKDLTARIPRDRWTKTHLVLIHHGRKTCMARNPSCRECPVEKLCPSSLLRNV